MSEIRVLCEENHLEYMGAEIQAGKRWLRGHAGDDWRLPSPGNVWILGSGHDGTLAKHMTTTGADSSLAMSSKLGDA